MSSKPPAVLETTWLALSACIPLRLTDIYPEKTSLALWEQADIGWAELFHQPGVLIHIYI